MSGLSQLLFANEKKRSAFFNAFEQGRGLNKADRFFVNVTRKYAELKFVVSFLLGFALFAIFIVLLPGDDTEQRQLMYQVLTGGLFVGLLCSVLFVPQLMTNFYSRRTRAALRVAECVASSKEKNKDKAMEACDIPLPPPPTSS